MPPPSALSKPYVNRFQRKKKRYYVYNNNSKQEEIIIKNGKKFKDTYKNVFGNFTCIKQFAFLKFESNDFEF